METKKEKKKLSFNVEQIRELTDSELEKTKAVGGATSIVACVTQSGSCTPPHLPQ